MYHFNDFVKDLFETNKKAEELIKEHSGDFSKKYNLDIKDELLGITEDSKEMLSEMDAFIVNTTPYDVTIVTRNNREWYRISTEYELCRPSLILDRQHIRNENHLHYGETPIFYNK